MAWLLNNAGTIASLGAIGGYIFTVVKYLRSKMKIPTLPQPTSSTQQQKVSVSHISISLNQWLEILGQGCVDTVDWFIKKFNSQPPQSISEERWMVILAGGCGVPILGALVAACLAVVFVIFGMDYNHGFQVAAQILCVLVFLFLSALYVYHVGERIQERQPEYQQEPFHDMEVMQ